MARRSIGPREWGSHLRALAAARLDGEPKGAPVGFLRWIRGEPAHSPCATPGATLDDALWHAIMDPAADVLGLLKPYPDGPLFDQSLSKTIEVWTERELSGLHALWRVAAKRNDESVMNRVHTTARWHVEHTQPDNATNRPWAAHVFLLISFQDDDAGARLYAETLVHNCQTTHGVPDPLSGLILEDCASALAQTLGQGVPGWEGAGSD